MATKHTISEVTKNGKKLIFFAASLHNSPIPQQVEAVVAEAFEKLSPYMKEENQILFIRDIPDYCIDGEFPAVCYASTEASIAIPSWSMDKRNVELLELSVHQAMLLLARTQNIGYNQTFGDDVFNQGIAAHYASIVTGYDLPYEGMVVTRRLFRAALRRWPTKRYYASWQVGGKHSKWRGHLVGWALAMAVIPKRYDRPFDIEFAIKSPGRMLDNQLWAMGHGGVRSKYAFHGHARRPLRSYLLG